jgi:hypothetical protein
MELTELDRREWFREHWARGIPFNQHCGIEVRRWDDEAVELFLPSRSASPVSGRTRPGRRRSRYRGATSTGGPAALS